MALRTAHLHTAGKVTVYTTFLSLFIVVLAFLFNLGGGSISEVGAQSNATTSVTVLNTAPLWTATTTEEFESSSNNPTNAGNVVSWIAIGTDSNAEDYYLLICSTPTAPSATPNGAPTCNGGIQWAVSTATISGTQARAATTTLHSWSEVNNWYAWICDGNSGIPKCNTTYTQGTNATNSSPFEVNHRPNFTAFWDDSPKLPGQVVTFYSTSSDSDVSGTPDTVRLFVCATPGFSTTTQTCTGTTLASTTGFVAANATATYTIIIPTQDQNYGAYGYIIDNHGFEATTTQGSNSVLSVANAAPTVNGADINLNNGNNMTLTVAAGTTTGFTLSFIGTDSNGCKNLNNNNEMRTYALSIYRNGTGPINSSSSTCSVTSGPFNPNYCYTGASPSLWGLSCTASSTSCTGPTDTTMQFDCTFSLWYVADPTDGTSTSTQYSSNDWRAQVQVGDDGQEENLIAATSSLAQSIVPNIEVTSFLAFALNTLSIPYGALEPGQQTDPLNATTTISATGNVGLDKDVTGESMCTTYTNAVKCPNSATSTIPESEQVFATSTVAYNTALTLGNTLSSTTPKEIEINVPKSTSTSTPAFASAYWGIRVPSSITFAGDYTGENTFTAKVGEPANW